MRQQTILACLLALAPVAAGAQSWPAATQQAKPGARWWWMGSAVTPEDLKYNIAEYARCGIGALEITPIYGVQGNESRDIDFLSPRWMDMLRQTEALGRADGVQIDMNSGTGWPFGGPEVPIDEAAAKVVYTYKTADGKALLRGVDMSVADDKEKPYARLDRLMAYDAYGHAFDLTAGATPAGAPAHTASARWTKADKRQTYKLIAVYCSRTRQKVKRAAPGGEGWVIDHFDRDAVAHYLARFDNAFAASATPWPHTFFNDSYEVYGANWTPRLFTEFEARRGYRLQDHLLQLFGLEADKDNQTLVDYRETLADLVLENFSQQWTAWAHSHGVITRNQAHGSPANLIDVYSSVDIPEIEGFGLSEFNIKGLRRDSGFTRVNDSDESMLKYASSSAHIMGRTLASSETFTWLTEHFRTSLSQMKPDLDLMFTCGVNNMYFHGTTYSPKDEQWPGWKFYASIDMSPTNSIWHDAPYFMKYAERCQSFLQMGKPDADFLVYLPVRDMWAQRKGTGDKSLLMQFSIHDMKAKAPDFIRSILEIRDAGFDCDYISDRYLLTTDYADGRLQTAAGTRYSGLVVPGAKRMPEVVRQHLDSLKAKGAKIVYATDAATLAQMAAPEPLRAAYGLRYIRRSNPTGYHYFIANLTPESVSARIPLAVKAADARWFDPMTGSIYRADINGEGVAVSLRSGESLILQTYNEALATPSPERTTEWTAEKPLTGQWTFAFESSQPRVDKSFTLAAPAAWQTLDDDSVRYTMGTGSYTTTIRMTANEATAAWTIDLGDVRESARVWVNGTMLGCAWAVPYTLDLGRAFRKGDNQIRIDVTNLPTNRIIMLDRQGVKWRKFKDTNINSVNGRKGDYSTWELMPSGLNSPVRLLRNK